ncbi:MAG: hypothetical protein JW724_04690, partial [Candidatus Altiarchaeota archaeon]|nr:hypothetical protein [Candidatus Altiarchaeota archaeon]
MVTNMAKKYSILLILVAAFLCTEVCAAVMPLPDFSVSDHAPEYPACGMGLYDVTGSGTGGYGSGPFVGSALGPDEPLENDKAEAIRRLNALIESIRSYAKRRHSLSEQQDRSGAAQLKNELKSIEDFIGQKKLSGYSDINAKSREAFLLNDQFNLSETLQDIWDLKKEIEAFNAARSGYGFAQEEEGIKRFEEAMKKIEKFAKDVCNKYDAEERVASEMRKARELLLNYVSPAKADTMRALADIDRRILEFNRIKHTYTESQRNASRQALENAIKEKEAVAKSRRFDGDRDFRDLVKLVKEHLGDDRTPMNLDMDALKATYNRMSKPLSVADINMMKNEIGGFQSKYGSALKQSANRDVNNQFNS